MNASSKALILLFGVACAGTACGSRPAAPADPATPAERRLAGDSLMKQLSTTIAGAPEIAFTSEEIGSRTTRNGQRHTLRYTRELSLRRPGSLYFVMKGERDLEVFYQDSKVTLVSHKDKVFAEFPTTATLDETVDVISYRYGIPMPVGELLTLDPSASLLTSETTGGWSGREAIDGVPCIRLSWQEPRVDWSIWIEERAPGLPRKLEVSHKAHKAQPATTIVFKSWNLTPQIATAVFTPRVPADYEGIAAIQRAAAVLTEDDLAGAAAAQPAPATRK
jgi:hypothetical protein